ncbi:MAG: rhamnogalacturonan acetylesterase [Luteolibacter sp.]|uniref:rhamnogalacturonan acetylesterase n=1 Tax=Luteolibacter sp. TaxID=1962973 RepID=UPI003267A19B
MKNPFSNACSRRGLIVLFSGLLALGLLPVCAEDDRPIVSDKDAPKENVAKNNLPTLWIAGDSTLRSNAPLRGWGQDLGTFFDPKKINVVNRAIGGRSSRTFFTEGRWKEILDGIKPGDFVIIQFGHNDVGALDEKGKFRGSVKGIGDGTEKVAKPDGTIEEVHSYGWYLKEMARTAREKKAKVILCSPVPHMKFDRDGKSVHDWKEYRGYVEACAKSEHAIYLDLAERIGNAYDKLDQETIKSYFADKGTHTSATGSLFNAKQVVSGLRSIPTAPLDIYLNAAGKEVPAS